MIMHSILSDTIYMGIIEDNATILHVIHAICITLPAQDMHVM